MLKSKELIEGSVKPSHNNNMGLPQDQLKVGAVITAHDNCEIQMGLGHLVISFVAHSSWEQGESSKAVASQSCTRVLSLQQCSSNQSKQLSKVIVLAGCFVEPCFGLWFDGCTC